MFCCYMLALDCIILRSTWRNDLSLPIANGKSCQVYRCITESLCDMFTVEIRQKITGVLLKARQLASVKLFGAKLGRFWL